MAGTFPNHGGAPLRRVEEAHFGIRSTHPDETPHSESPSSGGSVGGASAASSSVKLTVLGALVINSCNKPIASVGRIPTLPRAKDLLVNDPHAAATIRSTTETAGVAPNKQPHAADWQAIIDSGRKSQSLTINNTVTHNPKLIVPSTSGGFVTAAISKLVDAKSKVITPAGDVKLAALEAKNTYGNLHGSLTWRPHVPFTSGSRAPTAEVSDGAVVPPLLFPDNLTNQGADSIPPGFIVVGDIQLFGNIEAERYTFKGTAAGDCKTEVMVVKKKSISMNDLLSSSGLSFGEIVLQDPTVSVYSKDSPSGRAAGLWLDATLVLNGEMAEAGTFLANVFANSIPSIAVSVHLGGYQALDGPFKAPTDLQFIASLVGLDVKIGSFLELKSAQLAISGTRSASPGSSYNWSFGLRGSALLTVPGSIAPLSTTYTVVLVQSSYIVELRLVQEQWSDAMGVPGFHLQKATIKSSFTTSTKHTAFLWEIDALLDLGFTTVTITGHYDRKGWNFHADIGAFSLQNLESTFSKLFKVQLCPCNHSVIFSGVSLYVTSEGKTLLLQGGVTVDDYACAKASLSLSGTGIHLTGDMASITFEKVDLKKAHMDLVITKAGLVDPSSTRPGTTAAFTITGRIVIDSLISLDAKVVFAKKSNSPAVWVVYAKIPAKTRLSKFVPDIPSDLDLALESAVATATNTDDDDSFPAHFFDYKLKKGFHLHAMIDIPKALALTLNTTPATPPPTEKLLLQLDLGSAKDEVQFTFLAGKSLMLKPGIYVPSIKAGIMLASPPSMFVEGDLSFHLSGQSAPFITGLRLDVGLTEARASAFLKTDWVNPFNVSKSVKVLAPVTLTVLIDYAAMTYPSGFGLKGDIQVGETLLGAAFEVGENPKDGVLVAQIKHLGIRDVVSFTSSVIGHQLPLPSNNIFDYEDVFLGLSTGGTIGTIFYPPGATFYANMLIFNESIKIKCDLDPKLPGFRIHCEMASFQLVPGLTVTGCMPKTKNPILDVVFSTKSQSLVINGEINLFKSDTAITVTATLAPLKITFDGELKFSDLLLFKVVATATGDIHSIKDISKADFTFSADFEQKLLDQMEALARSYIATAKKMVDEGSESAQNKLNETQKEFSNHLGQCQRDLNDARQKWEKLAADTNAEVGRRKQQIAQEEKAARDSVDNAEQAFNSKIRGLKQSLQQAQNNAASAVNAATLQLKDAQRAADENVDEAVRQVNDAQQSLTNAFGGINSQIENAQNGVNGAQSAVRDQQRDVDNCWNTMNNGNAWAWDRAAATAQYPELEATLLSTQAALATANGVLSAAQAALYAGPYNALNGALDVANGALAAAKQAADASIQAANQTLQGATTAGNIAVSAAQQTLDAAERSCAELDVWNSAKAALITCIDREAPLTAAADALIHNLSTCAEKIAFDAADAALKTAQGATKELDAARAVLAIADDAFDVFSALGEWAAEHAGSIMSVQSVHVSGTLHEAKEKDLLTAGVKGTFAEAAFDISVDFTPGQAEALVKDLVTRFVDEAKGDMTRFVKAFKAPAAKPQAQK